MRRATLGLAFLMIVSAATLSWAGVIDSKLPKCSMQLCRDTGSSPDTLCVSGAHVKNCADVCNGK